MDIQVRDALPTDIPMVFDSYLKSWRISKFAGTVPNHLYFDAQRVLLEDLIARGAKVVVAYPKDHEDIILGWACGELKEGKTVLHYAYVKDPYLGLGIAESLLARLPGLQPGFITHRLPSKALKEWRWAPEIARRKTL